MDALEQTDPDAERVRRWRYEQLRELDISPADAVRLMDRTDIRDQATKLVVRGCPVDLVARILD